MYFVRISQNVACKILFEGLRFKIGGLGVKGMYTAWNIVLLEKPPVIQPVRKFPSFYGTQRFITMLTKASHWTLS
jgi:hypothetical protein